MRIRYLGGAVAGGLVVISAFIACGGDDDSATSAAKDAGTDAMILIVPVAETGTMVVDSGTTKKLLYSEDFESYGGAVTNGAKVGPWAASLSGTTMTVDGTQAFSGTKALHVTTTIPDGGPSHGTLQQAPDGGTIIPGNDLHGRAMVYYSDATGFGLPLGVHSWFFNASGLSAENTAKNVGTNLGGGGAALQLNHGYIDGGEQSVHGGTITARSWHCIQWELDGSGMPTHVESKVWLDGTQVIDDEGPAERVAVRPSVANIRLRVQPLPGPRPGRLRRRLARRLRARQRADRLPDEVGTMRA